MASSNRSFRSVLIALAVALLSSLLMIDALMIPVVEGFDIPITAGFYLIGVGYMGHWCEGWLVHSVRSRTTTMRVILALVAAPTLFMMASVLAGLISNAHHPLRDHVVFGQNVAMLPIFVIWWVALASGGTALALTIQGTVARLSGGFQTQVSVLLLFMALSTAIVSITMALVPAQFVSLLPTMDNLTVQLNSGEVMTGAEASDWVSTHQALVQGLLTFVGLMLILPVMLSALTRFSSSVVERIEPLQDGFRVVARGDLEIEIAETGAREFKELAHHFNLMIEKLRDSKRLERTFGQYVSPQLLDRITATHGLSQINGETRDGSVLFADIRGFTNMTETHGAEVVVGVLNRYFGEVVTIINAHEGYLDKFIGDEVFVVFNGPIDQPDHIERAVRCAIAILERVAEMNKKGAFDVVGGLGVGAGVATGTMVVGNVGSSQHLEYTVVGDAVNVAARLTGIAAPGQALISPDTAKHLPDDLVSQALSEVTLKGKTNPIVPHQVLRRTPLNETEKPVIRKE